MTEELFKRLLDLLPFLVTLLSLIAAATSTGLVAFSFRRSSHYNEQLRKAELSLVRSSLEAEIAKLNHQLLATDERFREVNHLVISAQRNLMSLPKGAAERTRFLDQFRLTDKDYEIDNKLIFVLTPFNSEEDETFDAIRDACSKAGLYAMRGDEENIQGDILTHVVKQICKARLIIANVGSRNPNVFYELGLAQAIGKQTLLVASHASEIPFDIQSMRIVLFSEASTLRETLPNAVLKVLAT